MSNLEEIKGFINEGYELEIIALECDVELDFVKKLKEKLDTEKMLSQGEIKVTTKEPEVKKKTRSKKVKPSRLQLLRDKYNEIYNHSYRQESIKASLRRELTDEEIALTQSTIADMEKLSMSAEGKTKQEKSKILENMFSVYSNIEKLPLPSNYVAKVWNAVECDNFKEFQGQQNQFAYSKKKIVNQMVEALNEEVALTDDLNTLKVLERRIKGSMSRFDYIRTSNVTSRISSKLSKAMQEANRREIMYNVSDEIKELLKVITTDKLDPKKAEELLDKEVSRRMASSPEGKFALTKEQHRNSSINQIRSVIQDRAEEYPFDDPELVFENLNVIMDSNQTSFNAVVTNLLARREYQKAKQLQRFVISEKYLEMQDTKFMMNQVTYAEIGIEVLRALNTLGEFAEEEAVYESLINGLSKNRISLQQIKLGKNIDKTRDITLAEIMPKEKTR